MNNNSSFNQNNASIEIPLRNNQKTKFTITKENLIEIVIKNQQREFADEVDLLETSYG
jgi:hypothetical protein